MQFQSSPSPKTGRYLSKMSRRQPSRSNPHPVRKLGAMRVILAHLALKILFQSSPSPKTGRYYCRGQEYRQLQLVPILTQSENWAL